MSALNIYEMYGRLAEERQQAEERAGRELASHLQTIALLRDLKEGRKSLDRLTVDVASWSYALEPDVAPEAAGDAQALALLRERNGSC